MKMDDIVWIDLASSALARVAYDHRRQLLHVEFRDGALCLYLAVPRTIYHELLNSPSPGGYFNTKIRNGFAYSAKSQLG